MAFSKSKPIQDLLKLSSELTHLEGAAEILAWDQETYMPPKGGPTRALQMAALSGIHHDKLTDPKVGKLLRQATKVAKTTHDKALVREISREYFKAVKLPKQLVKDISEAESRATLSWRQAKEKSDFSLFSKDLEKLLTLKVKAAKLKQKKGQTLYDVFLDDYEPKMTEKGVQKVFDKLRPKLVNLSSLLAKTTKGADKVIAQGPYSVAKQTEFGHDVIGSMGFDFSAGRQDLSTHPFTCYFGSVGDVRITTHENISDFRNPLFSTIHETGHALHFQGVDPQLNHTHLFGGSSYGLDESQSRFWENIIARSLPFWQYYYPLFQKNFPDQLKHVTLLDFVKAINVVKPSLVRVEADEVTYGLHIILRFDIERLLLSGKIKVKDLPKVWNQKVKAVLGIIPANDREGVLQDIHWSKGSFGYFPTYLLGNLIAAQLWFTLEKEIPNLKKKIAAGDLLSTRQWLQKKIHQHGKIYASSDIIQMVTGEPLNSDYFVRYLEQKFANLYPL